MDIRFIASMALATLCLSACSNDEPLQTKSVTAKGLAIAPGAPGAPSTWSFSGKTGIGTSFEAYLDGQHSDEAETGTVSKVWFSVANGVLTETMSGLIHEAQLKDLKLAVLGEGFVDFEDTATDSNIEYLHVDDMGRPLSLAYKITNTDREGNYVIEKHIFTDPESQSVFHRVLFTPKIDGLRLFVVANPHVGNTGEGDSAALLEYGGELALTTTNAESNTALSIISDTAFINPTVGFVEASDLATDLNDQKIDWRYSTTGEVAGNVGLGAELPVESTARKTSQIDLVIGFGDTGVTASAQAGKALSRGYSAVLADYNGEGEYVGWEDYLAGLAPLASLSETTTDGGKLLYASALVLKAQEDKTYSGALIASLSNPWGDIVSAKHSSSGYKAVWPRDFYQCAMAFLALGDIETPLVAFKYLEQVQVGDNTPGNKGAGGWFLQKTRVNGDLEWFSVQMDQVAMPVMLGWKLWQLEVLSRDELAFWYTTMLKEAADFMVDGGKLDLDWNTVTIEPPYTQQERWEEQEGYSPSSIAAMIAGLVTASDIASELGDAESAQKYLAAADQYEAELEQILFTETGVFTGDMGNGKYYLRISQNKDPNDNGDLLDRNGRGILKEKEIIDGGFLELVRYGVRSAENPHVLDTLEEYDNENIPHDRRVKYTFADGENAFPGWRRYGHDGYGEMTSTGEGYAKDGENHPDQRGRVWPFFTGERGHYELQTVSDDAGIENLRKTYIAGLEFFANEGLMLPEQVWDGVGSNAKYGYEMGDGTNSATPLAWTHAEYVKLVRSVNDRAVWDFYPIVRERYKNK